MNEIEAEVVESKRIALERKKSLLTPKPEDEWEDENEEDDKEEEKEKETEEKAGEGEAVHTGVSCNGCSKSPITGNRYKCNKYVLCRFWTLSYDSNGSNANLK